MKKTENTLMAKEAAIEWISAILVNLFSFIINVILRPRNYDEKSLSRQQLAVHDFERMQRLIK